MNGETKARIESELEVNAYIQNLKYALDNGAKLTFQVKRLVDTNRDEKYTNQYTVNTLFPDESPEEALKRELRIAERAFTPDMFPYRKTQRRCFHENENSTQ